MKRDLGDIAIQLGVIVALAATLLLVVVTLSLPREGIAGGVLGIGIGTIAILASGPITLVLTKRQ